MSTTRFPQGVTNQQSINVLGAMGQLDPTKYHTYFNDFDTFNAADWTITTIEGGAGSATEALSDADGGVLVSTNDDAATDRNSFQKVGESFLMASGKPTWFKARFKVSDATQSDVVLGLMVTDTDPFAAGGDGVTDGIFFQKDDGDALIDFYVQKNITTGQLTTTGVGTLVSDTYTELGWYYDGQKTITVWQDDNKVATVDITNTFTTYMPDTELTVTFGLKNGEAVAKVLSVDYLFVAKAR